jgi:hypothetical protein
MTNLNFASFCYESDYSNIYKSPPSAFDNNFEHDRPIPIEECLTLLMFYAYFSSPNGTNN